MFNTFKNLFSKKSIDFNERLRQGALLVDVRTKKEFEEGHAKNSLNIPLQVLLSNIDKLKNKEVVLVCRSGMRARSASKILKKHGIVSHNAGAWQNIKE